LCKLSPAIGGGRVAAADLRIAVLEEISRADGGTDALAGEHIMPRQRGDRAVLRSVGKDPQTHTAFHAPGLARGHREAKIDGRAGPHKCHVGPRLCTCINARKPLAPGTPPR